MGGVMCGVMCGEMCGEFCVGLGWTFEGGLPRVQRLRHALANKQLIVW